MDICSMSCLQQEFVSTQSFFPRPISAMSYPYENTTSSAPFDMPLGAYQLENLSFEDYFQTQLCQTQPTNPLSSPTRARRHPSTTTSTSASSLLPSWDSNASSSSFYPVSRSSSLPSLSWTPDVASSSDFYPIPDSSSHNPRLSLFTTPLTEDDLAFFANIDPSLLDSHFANITTNPSIPHTPEPAGRVPPPSKKRPYTNDEPEGLNNATFYRKRRKLSSGHQTLPNVPPENPYYSSSNSMVSNTTGNFIPPPTSHTNAMLSQAPCSFFQNVPVNTPAASLPAALPAYYSAATQPCPSVAYGRSFNYPSVSNEINPNVNSFNAAGHDALSQWDPLSYLTFPEVENGFLDWITGIPGSESFYNATSIGATQNPALIPPFLGRQAPQEASYGHSVANTDAFVNNETHSGVDFCQHLSFPNSLSTTGHVANTTMSNACEPSTSEASSVETVAKTSEHSRPSSSSTPSPNRVVARPKRRREQLLPIPELWTHDGNNYICLYRGPAKPNGCNKTAPTSRNLTRHMRTRAHWEEFLKIPEAERVAFNGLPEGLRDIVVTCPLSDADLHQCSYYQEHGKRWSTDSTLKRTDNILRQHRTACHPPQPKKERKVKRKTRAA